MPSSVGREATDHSWLSAETSASNRGTRSRKVKQGLARSRCPWCGAGGPECPRAASAGSADDPDGRWHRPARESPDETLMASISASDCGSGQLVGA